MNNKKVFLLIFINKKNYTCENFIKIIVFILYLLIN